MALGYQIERRRSLLPEARVVPIELAPGEGEVIAHIDLAALTANNVTYAVHGGAPLHYWNFFPATDAEWGVVPVWGYAVVVESRHPDIAVGARFFGYWPSASHLKLRPGPLKAGGFADLAAHRQGLAPVYNNYRPAGGALVEMDELTALFQPLYGTGFVLGGALLSASGLVGMTGLGHAALWRDGIARLLLGTMPGMTELYLPDAAGQDQAALTNLFSASHAFAPLSLPALWIGAVFGLACVAGAVWLRRRSDDS